jgi:transcription antitermination factor NusG
MAALRDSLQSRKVEPHPYLTVGQKVRIKSGPLRDFVGILARRAGGLRVVILVELIRQAVAVEVEAEELDAIGTVPPRFPSALRHWKRSTG